MRFSAWLSLQLEEQRMEKTKAAELFSVSRYSLHKWLTGQSFPSLRNLKQISIMIALLRNEEAQIIQKEIANTITTELELAN